MNIAPYWVVSCTLKDNIIQNCILYRPNSDNNNGMGNFEVIDNKSDLNYFVIKHGLDKFGNIKYESGGYTICNKAKPNYCIYKYNYNGVSRQFYLVVLSGYNGCYMWAIHFPGYAPDIFVGTLETAKYIFKCNVEDLETKLKNPVNLNNKDLYCINNLFRENKYPEVEYGFNIFNGVISKNHTGFKAGLVKILDTRKKELISIGSFDAKYNGKNLGDRYDNFEFYCRNAFNTSFGETKSLEYVHKLAPVYKFRYVRESDRSYRILSYITNIMNPSGKKVDKLEIDGVYSGVYSSCNIMSEYGVAEVSTAKLPQYLGESYGVNRVNIGQGGAVLTLLCPKFSVCRVEDWFFGKELDAKKVAEIKVAELRKYNSRFKFEKGDLFKEIKLNIRGKSYAELSSLDKQIEDEALRDLLKFRFNVVNGKPGIEFVAVPGVVQFNIDGRYIIVISG